MSSSERPMGSGMRKVKRKPRKLVPAKMTKVFPAPIPVWYPGSSRAGFGSCATIVKQKAPKIAPSFPTAADMPWHVVRKCVGNISAGTMNVVVFGPKLQKKKVNEYRMTNPVGLWSRQCVYGIPKASRKMHIIRKPWSWMGFLPMRSMRSIVAQYPGTMEKSAMSAMEPATL